MITFLVTAKRKNLTVTPVEQNPATVTDSCCYKHFYVRGKNPGTFPTNRKQILFISFTIESYFHLLIENSTVVTSYPHIGVGTK